jgi:hypothetical protein
MILKQLIKYPNGNYLEATWVNENDEQVYCRAFAGEEMDELVSMLTVQEAQEHSKLIADCRAAVVPYVVPPPVVPNAVTPFQAKAALLQAGLLDAVNTALVNAPALTKLAWAEATEFRRNSPTVLTLAGVLKLTDKQLDDLFIAASGITA